LNTIAKTLLSMNKSFITLDELKKLFNSDDYKVIYEAIEVLMEQNFLCAVKASGKNGRIPSLYMKYKIIKTPPDTAEYKNEIMRLHSSLNISGYLKYINIYIQHREAVTILSDFLKLNIKTLLLPMSRNERSYAIWKNEKALDASKYTIYSAVVKFNGLEERLNYYGTPEPFFDYVHTKHEKMSVLILENKDTWFTLRKIMSTTDGNVAFFGKIIDVLLYGEGNKINKEAAITAYRDNVLCSDVNFYYFGDLDYEGIYLYLKVKEVNPAAKIELFVPFYTLMLDLADKNLSEIRANQRKPAELQSFINYFQKPYATRIEKILAENCYIPQEIVNYHVILDLLDKR